MDCLARAAAAVDFIFQVERAPRPKWISKKILAPPATILLALNRAAKAWQCVMAEGAVPDIATARPSHRLPRHGLAVLVSEFAEASARHIGVRVSQRRG